MPCQYDATCTDQVNSYTCTCVAGFTGTNCEASRPCGSGIVKMLVTCINKKARTQLLCMFVAQTRTHKTQEMGSALAVAR